MTLRKTRVWRAAGRGLATLALLATAHADDHGNNLAAATPLVPDASPQLGMIETDVDKDWFVFPALPWIGYAVTVTTGTLWDSEVELLGADGSSQIIATNSVEANGPLTLIWSNSGAATKCGVQVGGFAEFTTGTYFIAVTRLNWQDGDADGLFDPWEISCFGHLAQGSSDDPDGDGFSNVEEYYLQSDPADASDGLRISRMSAVGTGVVVRWSAALHGQYRLWVSTNRPDVPSSWQPVGQKVKQQVNPPWEEMVDPAASNAARRVYRVEFFY